MNPLNYRGKTNQNNQFTGCTFLPLFYLFQVICTHIEKGEVVFEQNVTELDVVIKDFRVRIA